MEFPVESSTSEVQQNSNELCEKQRRNSSGEKFVRHGYAFEIVT